MPSIGPCVEIDILAFPNFGRILPHNLQSWCENVAWQALQEVVWGRGGNEGIRILGPSTLDAGSRARVPAPSHDVLARVAACSLGFLARVSACSLGFLACGVACSHVIYRLRSCSRPHSRDPEPMSYSSWARNSSQSSPPTHFWDVPTRPGQYNSSQPNRCRAGPRPGQGRARPGPRQGQARDGPGPDRTRAGASQARAGPGPIQKFPGALIPHFWEGNKIDTARYLVNMTF